MCCSSSVHGQQPSASERALGAGGGLARPRASGGAPRRRVPRRDRAHAAHERARRRHHHESHPGGQTVRTPVPRVRPFYLLIGKNTNIHLERETNKRPKPGAAHPYALYTRAVR